MQRNGNQGYQDEKCAWQIKVGYAFADVGKAKNVVVGDFLCRQPALEAEFGNTRNNQQDADDDVGQPGHELAHVRLEMCAGILACGAGPRCVPFGRVAEAPFFLWHAKAHFRAPDHNAEANQAAQHGRELWPQAPGAGNIGHQEADSSENTEFPGPESHAPGAFRPPEAGHEAKHEDGQDNCHRPVHEGGPFADNPGKAVKVCVGHHGAGCLAIGHGVAHRVFQKPEADQNRRAHRAKAYRHGVEHKADNGGRHGRKAKAKQKRGGQGGWGAEACRAFNKGREQKADNDGLDAAILAHILHAILDCLHAAAFFQGIKNKYGAKDDDQNAYCDDHALNRQSHKTQDLDFPAYHPANEAGCPGKGHCPGGGPAHSHHQDKGNHNRYDCQQRQKCCRHQ